MTFQCAESITLPPVSTLVRQNRFVVITAGGANEAGVDADTVGIAREQSDDGSTVAIPVQKKDGAVGEVEAAGAIAVGATLSSDAQGRALSGGTNPQAVALSAASAAGEVVTVIYGI